RAIMQQARTIRLPAHVVKELNVVLRALRHLETHAAGNAGEPSLDDVAHLIDRPVEDVRRILGYREHVMSLDARVGRESDETVAENVPDEACIAPEILLHNAEVEALVSQWLARLTARQRLVIERRYGLRGSDVATLEDL